MLAMLISKQSRTFTLIRIFRNVKKIDLGKQYSNSAIVAYNYAFVDNNEDRYNNYIVVIIRFTSIYR